MLKREYEGITGTSVCWDIYRDLIEPLYMNAPPWMRKRDFCASINAKALSEVPAVPNCFYNIDDKFFKCTKIDMVTREVYFENEILGTVKTSFENAMEWRKREYLRPM